MKSTFTFLFLCVQVFVLRAANVAITIQNSAFSPSSVNVHIGDVITWTNKDNFLHSVISTSVPSGTATFGSSTFGINETFTYTVTSAGDYTYKCGVHTSMIGTFTVPSATPMIKPTLTLNALYPNPAVETIHIESSKTIKSVDLYSETGVFIKTVLFNSDKIDLPINELR